MAIQVKLEGATVAQKKRVSDAFVGTQGPVPEGMTVAQFVNRALLRFIKSVVKGYERSQKETEIRTLQQQVDAEFPED